MYAAGQPEDKRLYYRLIDGGPPIALVDGWELDMSNPSYSPDGNLVLFESEGSIYTVEALGGRPRPIRVGEGAPGNTLYSDPTWSSTGDAIAYVSTSDNSYVEIFEIGSAEVTFTLALSRVHSLSFSPDDKFLAAVLLNHGHARYGNNIAPMNVIVIDLSDSSVHTITDPAFMSLSPRWGPDSDELFYISNRLGGQDVYAQKISSTGEGFGPPIRVTVGMNLHSMDLSIDGTRIAASDLNYTQNIYSWPLDKKPYATTADAVAITRGDQVIEGISVSTDGTQIAFDSNARGTSQIYTMPIAGGAPLQLTTGRAPSFVFDWSPYSDEISFHTFVNGVRASGLVHTAEQKVTILPGSNLHDRYPVWLGDENTLGVHREIGANRLALFLMTRGESGAWESGDMVVEDIRDGSQYSVVRNQLAFARNGTIGIWDIATDESWLLEETREHIAAYPMWSDDGNTIYFLSLEKSSLIGTNRTAIAYMSIPAEGGTVRKVVDFTNSNKTRYFGDVNGNHVYTTRLEVESDLVVIDLERQ